MIGKFCGNTLPGNNGTIISTRNTVSMQFRSDHSVADHGFHLSWNTTLPVCGDTITGQTRGTIMSPGYPGVTINTYDQHCTLTVTFYYRQVTILTMLIVSGPSP